MWTDRCIRSAGNRAWFKAFTSTFTLRILNMYVEHLNRQLLRRGDDTVGNPHRVQIHQFELFELILLFELDKQLHVEQFEATAFQSTVPSPLLVTAIVVTKIALRNII